MRSWIPCILTLLAAPAFAATLDAASVGDDVVFTWDTAGPDTILRGTQPDNMVPWLVNVTSPVTAPGENQLRGENAFYELASGSNRAWRLEVLLPAPPAGGPYISDCISLPERRSYVALDLFALWPDLRELEWWDPVLQKRMALARFGADVIGDAAPLPRHGGVRAGFLGPTSITIVGSRDDAYSGPDLADLETDPSVKTVVGFPPDALAPTLLQVLCGFEGVDWFDLNADGYPDDCGPDRDGDGFADSGLWRAPVPPISPSAAQATIMNVPQNVFMTVTGAIALGSYRFTGFDIGISSGAGIMLDYRSPADLNLPFRPPIR